MSRPEVLRARDEWVRAVWDSDLTTTQRIVALAFGHWARNGLDDVFVVPATLQQMSGLGRTAAKAALRDLQRLGWLVCVQQARQQWVPHYALRTPTTATQDVASRHSDKGRVSVDDTLRGPAGDTLEGTRVSGDGTRVSGNGTRVSPSDPYHSSQISSHHPADPARSSDDHRDPDNDAVDDESVPTVAERFPVEAALRTAGVSETDLHAVTDLALADSTTTGSVVGRITKVPSYVEQLVRQAREARQQTGRQAAVDARCAAIDADLDAAGDLGAEALSRAAYVLGPGRASNRLLLLKTARDELDDLRDQHHVASA